MSLPESEQGVRKEIRHVVIRARYMQRLGGVRGGYPWRRWATPSRESPLGSPNGCGTCPKRDCATGRGHVTIHNPPSNLRSSAPSCGNATVATLNYRTHATCVGILRPNNTPNTNPSSPPWSVPARAALCLVSLLDAGRPLMSAALQLAAVPSYCLL